MTLFSRQSPEFHRDRLLDLLQESPFVQQKLAEDEHAKIAERQKLVDQIAAVRAHAAAQTPVLERKARDAHSKLQPIMAKLEAAERDYTAAVRELADLDFHTSHQINQAEIQLRRTADRRIQDFISHCIDHHDRLRFTPRQHVTVKVLPAVRVHDDAKVNRQEDDVPVDVLALALAETRRIRAEAEALFLTACPDVESELDRLKAQLPSIDGEPL